MSKKKPQKGQRPISIMPPQTKASRSQPAIVAEPPSPPMVVAATPVVVVSETPDADPLVSEVQTLLTKRDDLARKLAEEIAVTERKLAELKRTAALLNPETAEEAAHEKKPKKAKPKAERKPRAKKSAAEKATPAEPEDEGQRLF